jgi:hypothetical protein
MSIVEYESLIFEYSSTRVLYLSASTYVAASPLFGTSTGVLVLEYSAVR